MKTETSNEQTLPASKLVKSQHKTFGPKFYTEHGRQYRITAKVHYDDQCGNGHNTFSITADIDEKSEFGKVWRESSGGCCHDEVAKHFPELAPLIKWHGVSSDEPMYYIENTVHHATEHGPTSAWVHFEDKENGIERQCMKYCDLDEAEKICRSKGYTMVIDPKTAKTANLDHARSSAVWPEATQEQLLSKEALLDRLPALMAEFKTAVESLGFVY